MDTSYLHGREEDPDPIFHKTLDSEGTMRTFVVLDEYQFERLSYQERCFEILDWYDDPVHGRLYQLQSLTTGKITKPEFHASAFCEHQPIEIA